MVKKIGAALVAVIVAAIAFVATRPADFRIERSATLIAPGEVVFPLLDDFHRWAEWSPFDKLDPNMKKTYDGPSAGAGASYSWEGNSSAGSGRATILESKLNELVSIKLEFLKPLAATNRATFALTPATAGTRVSWAMEGKNGFVAKAFCVFVDMDSVVGKEFEEGLGNLKRVAQSETKKADAARP